MLKKHTAASREKVRQLVEERYNKGPLKRGTVPEISELTGVSRHTVEEIKRKTIAQINTKRKYLAL